MRQFTNIILSVLVFTFFSCRKDSNTVLDPQKIPIVTVNDETLYKLELDEVLPRNLSAQDSADIAQSYIRTWINNRLMYDKAKQNVVNVDEINQLVEDYRKSLITNLYQEQLIKERFNKAVTDKDLETYYEENKEKIKLKQNIIKGLFLKIPIDSKELPNFQKWYKQTTDAAVENIEKKRLQNAVAYEYFYNDWVSLNVLTEKIPLSIDNEEQFLKTNKNIEVRDSSFVYLLNIRDYRLIGDQAPFDFMKTRLTEMYIEKERSDYMKQVQDDLYKKAISDKEIKFYDK